MFDEQGHEDIPELKDWTHNVLSEWGRDR